MVQEFQLDSRYAGYTVSEGTLKTKDLINAFEGFILQNVNGKAPVALGLRLDPRFPYREAPDEWFDSEDASWYVNEELYDYLNSIAPEGCYFGTLEGDGACFGFWPLEEA